MSARPRGATVAALVALLAALPSDAVAQEGGDEGSDVAEVVEVPRGFRSLREAGDAAYAALDFPAALAIYRGCARVAGDRDARYCAARAATLEPHAAEGFAGLLALERVRRSYRALGSDAAIAAVEDALAAHPESTAASQMRMWLAHERMRRDEPEEAIRAMGPAPEEDEATRWLAYRLRERALATKRAVAAGVGGAAWGVATLVGALRRGPTLYRSAATAALALGVVPTTMAALWGPGLAVHFARAGAVVALAVLLAARTPPWLAVPGVLGGLLASAWWAGWLPSMGF